MMELTYKLNFVQMAKLITYCYRILKYYLRNMVDPFIFVEIFTTFKYLAHLDVRINPIEKLEANKFYIVLPIFLKHRFISEGQWLYIKFKSIENKMEHHRWVRVFYSDHYCTKNACYISPILNNNICHKIKSNKFKIIFPNNSLCNISDLVHIWTNNNTNKTRLKNELAFIAKTVQVSVVSSPKYKIAPCFETILREAFDDSVALCKGDIIPITLPYYLATKFTPVHSIVPPEEIFIKIINIEGEIDLNSSEKCYLVNNNKTSLYLLNDINCDIPRDYMAIKETCLYETVNSHFNELSCVIEAMLNNDYRKYNSDFDSQENTDELEIVKTQECSNNWWDQYIDSYSELSLNGNTLIIGQYGSECNELLEMISIKYNFHKYIVNCWSLKGDTSASTIAKLQQKLQHIKSYGSCVMLLQEISCLTQDKDGNDDLRVTEALKVELFNLSKLSQPIFVLATAPSENLVKDELWGLFSFHLKLESIENETKKNLFMELFPDIDLDVNKLSKQTTGFTYGDFLSLRRHALWNLYKEIHTSKDQLKDTNISSNDLTEKHIEDALGAIQENRRVFLGTPKIPKVNWGEVGGLEEAKKEIIHTIQLPIKYPSLINTKLKRSGILLYGPPGTGKTLLAKAVATECGLNFMSVKGPELLNMYVGQSEQNVREVFKTAKDAAPCIIFFDEFDSLAPNRGISGDSGGVTDRIVSALLTELDDVSSSTDVFVLAATNRPDLIDPGLLRAGRFEKRIYLGVCDNKDDQLKVLKAVASKIPLKDNIQFNEVVKLLPMNLTGADFYALVTDALYNALRRVITEETANDVEVDFEDFKKAALNLIPSVSEKQLKEYEAMKKGKIPE